MAGARDCRGARKVPWSRFRRQISLELPAISRSHDELWYAMSRPNCAREGGKAMEEKREAENIITMNNRTRGGADERNDAD